MQKFKDKDRISMRSSLVLTNEYMQKRANNLITILELKCTLWQNNIQTHCSTFNSGELIVVCYRMKKQLQKDQLVSFKFKVVFVKVTTAAIYANLSLSLEYGWILLDS